MNLVELEKQFALLALDNGNGGLKAVGLDTSKDDFIPHAVVYLSDMEFENYRQRARFSPIEFERGALFRWGRKPPTKAADGANSKTSGGTVLNVLMGEPAGDSRVTGIEKFTGEDYFETIMLGMFLRRYPMGNKNIHLAIAFPYIAGAVYRQQLIDRIVGVTYIVETVTGEYVEFRIKSSTPADESIGGIFRWLQNVDGVTSRTIEDGQRILVADIGAKISHFVPVRVERGGRLQIDYQTATGFDVGIHDVFNLLIAELRMRFPRDFSMRVIPLEMLEEALLTETIHVSGIPVKVTPAVNAAVDSIIRRIEMIYVDKFGKGRGYNNIVVTGGGGGVLYQHLLPILDHNFIDRAERPNDMRFANARGILAGFRQVVETSPAYEKWAKLLKEVE